ncbi:PQQ-dependent sugar dehydrogenase [Actinomadura barringtoniae]|uniref:PQQ-dependent sugar dehydrogenase n=1 Tax=Actinomadura barringtoniae TaxID=1427535 RepID=A0A939PDK1_9ACTN|nr:PQQ-dependent sugar dehydrogenase [Actinomadura barringtoniae]MBO2450656.1 PQQ-dependent sugar dehydrogenase [Actinomadura barringtoniae]
MPKSRWLLLTIVAVLAALLQVTPANAAAPGRAAVPPGDPIYDPIPESPSTSGLGLTVEDYASFPKSEPTPAPTDQRLVRWARINHLGEVPDGSGRTYVPDLNGKLYFLGKDRKPHVYLDVGATFAPQFFSGKGMGQGFGFVTFDPNFRRNGRFYTVHTELASSTDKVPDLTPEAGTLYHGIITEWTADDPHADTFKGTRREVLRLGFAGQVHGIQQIDFNPTARPHDKDYGLLYVAAGDGGIGFNSGIPQDLSIPQGKILRIDPRGTNSANGKYGIPKNNPFTGQAGKLGEIYAYGMRDPHRFSWDPGGSHRLFLGHIGEHAIESVYDIRAGANLGWSDREGSWVFDKTATDPCKKLYPLPADDKGYTYPVAAYDHDPSPTWDCKSDVGRAIAGGYVYRGKIAALRGKYLFDDLVDGRIFYTEEREMKLGGPRAEVHQLMLYKDGKRLSTADLTGPGSTGDPKRADLRIGRDGAGELYLIGKANGKIWKITGTQNFASCDVGHTTVRNATSAKDWTPVTPSKWQFPGREVVLAEAGVERPGPRRPFEYAVLNKGPAAWKSFQLDAQVRLDTPVDIINRDVILVYNYNSDLQFSYTHLSSDNSIYPHNGMFTVNNADRLRLDDQWNAVRSHGAPPAIKDAAWHRVRIRHCGDSGETAAYIDGSRTPLITSIDSTFASGKVGFGSFDNIGRIRDLKVTGTPAA